MKRCQHGVCSEKVVPGTKFCAKHKDSDPNAFPWFGCVGFLVIVAIAIWIAVEIVSGPTEDSDPVVPDPQVDFTEDSDPVVPDPQVDFELFGADEFQAWFACQDAMNERLLAPTTATYQTAPDYQSSGDTYTFPRAFVDAENEFGADVRTFFRCAASYQGDDRWSVNIIVSN